jgi:hypothetical protein
VSDETVHAALRSDVPLVVVEAPGGCGKTHQGADYAHAIAGAGSTRLLILTHTNAACSVFAERTRAAAARVHIRTIDSLIAQLATAYHAGLGLPPDTTMWVRQTKDGHAHIALRTAALLRRHPMIAASVARRYPIVICDEHQDCSSDQHAVAMALLNQGARLRVFADPMQQIYKKQELPGGSSTWTWDGLKGQAHTVDHLDTPHRWKAGCPDLGAWTLKARATLQSGGKIDLRTGLPASVSVVVAENQAQRNLEYQLSGQDRRPIDGFEKAQDSLLILTHHNATARSLRGFFNRRIPLWEGYTRTALEKLVDSIRAGANDRSALAAAIVQFMGDIGKGFSPSAFGNQFESEARDGCVAQRRGKPAIIQELARFLVAEPDHRGVAKILRRLAELKQTHGDFSGIEVDCHKEFWDAVRLGGFDDVDSGLVEITNRRTYSRPRPPTRAISTIHKAKGLECNSVIVMPCDAKTFPDTFESRCLLYVAISRAKSRLLLVVSRTAPSPLLFI